MLRRLLTLLAICAGLAAVAEPARAAPLSVATVRMLERSSAPSVTRAATAPASDAAVGERVQERGKGRPKPAVVLVVPTVMLQADRARE